MVWCLGWRTSPEPTSSSVHLLSKLRTNYVFFFTIVTVLFSRSALVLLRYAFVYACMCVCVCVCVSRLKDISRACTCRVSSITSPCVSVCVRVYICTCFVWICIKFGLFVWMCVRISHEPTSQTVVTLFTHSCPTLVTLTLTHVCYAQVHHFG
jgi:hypothetical protein